MKLSYPLAILAAVANAASNTLQRKADKDEPPELAMRPQLILDLLHRPVWLAGLATVVASFLLDAAALSMGRLAVVQPILVLELPMTLIVASRVFGSRLRGRDWGAIGAMSAGVAGLIFCLAPEAARHQHIPALVWLAGVGITVGAVAACVAASSRGGPARRPALLGLGSGICFGLTAAFMKSATAGLHHGPAGIFETWSTYAMAVAGLSAMFLMQNALQAGPLFAAQPGITLADPGVAILWGILVFGERTRTGLWLVGVLASAAALGLGTVLLSRSRLLEDQMEPRPAAPGRVASEEVRR